MFINYSNHPSNKWEESQRKAAEAYGTIRDLAFPPVPACAGEEEVTLIANKSVDEIALLLSGSENDSAVMVQGEFSVTYAVVRRLLERGITAVTACSERKVKETVGDEGKPVKQVEFKFERFRQYA